MRQVDSWLLVHAAARLSEGIQTEQAMLTGVLDRAQRKATRRQRHANPEPPRPATRAGKPSNLR
jgi:hypothetical protein